MKNNWRSLDLENKVTQILRDIPDAAKKHHLGKPFLTAYQIAIEFAKRHPDDTSKIGFKVGGVGTGEKNSLSQYIANQLSRRIKSEEITHIEGGFLSNQHLRDINFKGVDGKKVIHSSLTNTNFTLSMFRIKG